MVGVKVRQGGEHWEEVYWTSLEAHFERHAYIMQHASYDPTNFPTLAQIVSFPNSYATYFMSNRSDLYNSHKPANSGLGPLNPDQIPTL